MRTAYEILGVSREAADEEIRLRYRELMKQVHSDVNIASELSKEENERKAREYNEAYENLKKGRRSEYDKKLNRIYNDANWSYSKAKGPNGEDGACWNHRSEQSYSTEEQQELYREAMRREQARREEEKEQHRRAEFERKRKEWEQQNASFNRNNGYDDVKKNGSQTQRKHTDSSQKGKTRTQSSSIFEGLTNEQKKILLDLLVRGKYSFMGSHTVDPNQKLKQKFWSLKSKRDSLLQQLKDEEKQVRLLFDSSQVSQGIFIKQEEINLTNYQNKKLEIEVQTQSEIKNLETVYDIRSSHLFPLFRKTRLKRLRDKMNKQQDEIIKNAQIKLQEVQDKIKKSSNAIEEYNKGIEIAIKSDPKIQQYKAQLSKINAQYEPLLAQLSSVPGFKSEYEFMSSYSSIAR